MPLFCFVRRACAHHSRDDARRTGSGQDRERDHALIAAAERGETVTVRRACGARGRRQCPRHRGRTALLLATHRNHVEVARFLIREGADVNARDLIQDTPFLYAGAQGRAEILKLTLEADADLKSTNRYGGTALIPAAHHGHVETVKILLATSDRCRSRQQPRLDGASWRR